MDTTAYRAKISELADEWTTNGAISVEAYRHLRRLAHIVGRADAVPPHTVIDQALDVACAPYDVEHEGAVIGRVRMATPPAADFGLWAYEPAWDSVGSTPCGGYRDALAAEHALRNLHRHRQAEGVA